MGWSSGSGLFSNIIESLTESDLSYEQRKTVYLILIEHFEDKDCDTLGECVGEDDAFDDAYYEIHPDYLEDELEEDPED